MIDYAKTAVLGMAPAILGFLASLMPWLNDLRTLLIVVSMMVAMATGLLGLWFRKLIRDREDERDETEEKRQERLDNRLISLEREVRETKGLFHETLAKHDGLRAEILRAVEESKRAHDRLDKGRESIHRIDVELVRVATIAGRRRPERADSNGD